MPTLPEVPALLSLPLLQPASAVTARSAAQAATVVVRSLIVEPCLPVVSDGVTECRFSVFRGAVVPYCARGRLVPLPGSAGGGSQPESLHAAVDGESGPGHARRARAGEVD